LTTMRIAGTPPMRVTFLSPRLPPAVCGLADHAKWLAGAMAKRRAEVGFIHCQEQALVCDLPPGPVDFWGGNHSGLEACLGRQRPDWLWVQLSGYGYSRWGAPYRLMRALAWVRRHLPDVRLAICVHETHCQPNQLGRKGPVLARWQRYTASRVARLGHVVFPTIGPYTDCVLHDYGVEPHRVLQLPIASNIPAVTLTVTERAQSRQALGWQADETVAVTFGTVVTQLRALEWFAPLLARGLREGHLHRVICVGGDDSGAHAELSAWETRAPFAGALQVLGRPQARRVGEILACSDFAFLPTSRKFIEKSGAFVACATAGLAVLVPPPEAAAESQVPPILAAESWDWQQAKSHRVARLRGDIQQYAQRHYDWDAIAQSALARLNAG
jgi:hypothetical protein